MSLSRPKPERGEIKNFTATDSDSRNGRAIRNREATVLHKTFKKSIMIERIVVMEVRGSEVIAGKM